MPPLAAELAPLVPLPSKMIFSTVNDRTLLVTVNIEALFWLFVRVARFPPLVVRRVRLVMLLLKVKPEVSV